MKVEINYGSEIMRLDLPDDTKVDEFCHRSINEPTPIDQFKAMLSDIKEALFDIADADLIVVNDGYRPTPTAMILLWLKSIGKLSETCRFLIATGCHQAPTESQLGTIFGSLYSELKNRIFIHDARSDENLAHIGKDSFGEAVYLNKLFAESKRKVVIGSVEPHYFAGFTGGCKSIAPGIVDSKTTIRNHGLAVSDEAQPMRLENNPVSEHIRSIAEMAELDNTIFIQIVSGLRGEHLIYCGELKKTFAAAVEKCRDVFGITCDGEYDLMLAETLPPLDANLYQLQKSIENCQRAVKDGGATILFSPCKEGIGSEAFYELAENWSPNESSNRGTESFGIHKLHRVYQIGQRIDLYLHSELPAGVSDKVFFKSIDSPQKIINELKKSKSRMRVALARDAGHTVLAN